MAAKPVRLPRGANGFGRIDTPISCRLLDDEGVDPLNPQFRQLMRGLVGVRKKNSGGRHLTFENCFVLNINHKYLLNRGGQIND